MSTPLMLSISSPDKVLWPAAGIRKADYLQYLIAVSPYLLPHLIDRPITFIRFPHGVTGESFYQKNLPAHAPSWLASYVDTSGEKPIHYALLNDLDSLLWAGNQNCLEIHPWYATSSRPTYPTQLAIDLDPTTDRFDDAREVAFYVRDALSGIGLVGYPKTSGQTGLQIYVPITPRYSFAETRRVQQFLAEFIATRHPDAVTLERRVKARRARVYLDYVQHAPHKTLPAPYSTRKHPQGTVS
ncbi:MAG: non-homologous end-joining DNA ligase, partial [Firmicutes bacterium]|nr:non-homologous end-joining DNA ligase [Bacillota bacterium]